MIVTLACASALKVTLEYAMLTLAAPAQKTQLSSTRVVRKVCFGSLNAPVAALLLCVSYFSLAAKFSKSSTWGKGTHSYFMSLRNCIFMLTRGSVHRLYTRNSDRLYTRGRIVSARGPFLPRIVCTRSAYCYAQEGTPPHPNPPTPAHPSPRPHPVCCARAGVR